MPAAVLVVAVLLVAMSGCGGAIAGHWRAVEVVPNREAFCVDDATFNRDGTFTATVTTDGKTTEESGRYSFSGFKLTLRPDAGGRRAYNALLKFGRLELTNNKRKVVLKKD
ncbi:MAG: lipocalin family protein [Phycisphaerae bacterium]|jgi:hypothetical protein